LTGGGWGGATINLVALDKVDSFKSELAERYRAKTGIAPDIFVSAIGEGARIVAI
jgi:galactokinase